MNKLKCIIADDEPIARKVLREFIEDVHFLLLVAEFENVRKLEAWLQNNEADVIFLDIEMPQKTGVEFLKENSIKPLIILTTAYPEYALDGYDFDVLDYLLKPIAFKRFLKAVQKAKEYVEIRNREAVSKSFLFVRTEKKIEKLNYTDILFIETVGNYVFIHTQEKKIMVYLTLKSIEDQLPSNEFIRVHQSYLISFSKIDSVDHNVIWIKNKQIPISRNHRGLLTKQILQYTLKR